MSISYETLVEIRKELDEAERKQRHIRDVDESKLQGEERVEFDMYKLHIYADLGMLSKTYERALNEYWASERAKLNAST